MMMGMMPAVSMVTGTMTTVSVGMPLMANGIAPAVSGQNAFCHYSQPTWSLLMWYALKAYYHWFTGLHNFLNTDYNWKLHSFKITNLNIVSHTMF